MNYSNETMEEEKTREYDVLGCRVKLAATGKEAQFSADDVVLQVREEAEVILRKNPNLSKAQVAVLVALKLAADKMTIDHEFKESVDEFQATARGAIEQIEQIEDSSAQ